MISGYIYVTNHKFYYFFIMYGCKVILHASDSHEHFPLFSPYNPIACWKKATNNLLSKKIYQESFLNQ